MNIVFWLAVIIILVAVWFLLSFAFKHIGGAELRIFQNAKKEIFGKNYKKSEGKDDVNDER